MKFVIFILLILVVGYFLLSFPMSHYLRARKSGINISPFLLYGMKFRNVPTEHIVDGMIKGKLVDLNLNPEELETYFIAGGNIKNIVSGLICAKQANINLDLKTAMALDLAGRNVFNEVQQVVAYKTTAFQEPTKILINGLSSLLHYSLKVGDLGKSVTNIHPIGKAKINGTHYYVESSGDYIDKNTDIVIEKIDQDILYIKTKYQ